MQIDFNADVGEECGDDAALIPLLTSANIACGAHAGGPDTMRVTVARCLQYSVRIGAHVSYPDREHFGRRELDLLPAVLADSVGAQLQALDHVVQAAGARIRYFKAHGALYNRMARDAVVAEAVVTALGQFDARLPILTLPGSVAMRQAKTHGISAVGEVFADRGYRDDGSLQPRNLPGALLTDPEAVAARMLAWLRDGAISTVSGGQVPLAARSVCIHGDTPGAVALAGTLREVLLAAGVELRAFT